MTLKALGSDNITVRPFKVHKDQISNYTSGSGEFAEMNVATAVQLSLLNDFDPNTATKNEDDSYQNTLYGTMAHMFYTSGTLSGSATFAAGGSGIRDFPLSSSAYVINIAQRLFGEGFRRGTFRLDTPAHGSGTIEDDGTGRLFVSGAGGSLNVVGNVFYNLGVAVVNQLDSADNDELIQETGMFFGSGSALRANFQATQHLYEYTVIATMEPFEFNYSINPTALGTSGTGSTLAEAGQKIQDLIGSGTLSPYVTSIGLYNDKKQLVAVAKVPRPIKRLVNSQQSIIVRFDL